MTVILAMYGLGKTQAVARLALEGHKLVDLNPADFQDEDKPDCLIEAVRKYRDDPEIKAVLAPATLEMLDLFDNASEGFILVFPEEKLSSTHRPEHVSEGQWIDDIQKLRNYAMRKRITAVELDEPTEFITDVVRELNLL